MPPRPTRRWTRRWTLRLLAVLSGLALVGLVELGLRLAGVSPGRTWEPPRLVQVVQDGAVQGEFAVRAGAHFVPEPLPDGSPGYRTAPDYRLGRGGGFPVGGAMRDEHVAAAPAPGVRRFVVLGGSAALGLKPVGPRARANVPVEKLPNGASALPDALSISGQLEGLLGDRGVTAEVVNAGMIAQDSGAVRAIAEEALAFRPNGLLLYLGNNEGIGMAFAMRDVELPAAVPVVRGAMRHSRIYRLLAGLVLPARPEAAATAPQPPRGPQQQGPRHGTGPHVLARITLAQWQSAGEPLVDGDAPTDTVSRAIHARLEANLRQVVEAATAQGVAVYIVPTPPHLGYPPFAESADPGLTDADLDRARRARQAAEAALGQGDHAAALSLAREAVDLDPGSGGAWYLLGRALDAAGEPDEAVDAMLLALARDVSRKRTQPAFNEIAERVCADLGCRTTSAHAAISARARQEGLGVYDAMLGDHEHLNPEGNAWIAGLFADLVAGEGR